MSINSPLDWPVSWNRAGFRRTSNFEAKTLRYPTLLERVKHLHRQFGLWGCREIRITGHFEFRVGYQLTRPNRDERRALRRAAKQDPGVAVSFERRSGDGWTKGHVGCDTYQNLWENVHALALAIGALRAVDRYGLTQLTGRIDAALAALPAFNWRAALQPFLPGELHVALLAEPLLVDRLRVVQRHLHFNYHPDRARDVGEVERADRWCRIQEALEAAAAEIGRG